MGEAEVVRDRSARRPVEVHRPRGQRHFRGGECPEKAEPPWEEPLLAATLALYKLIDEVGNRHGFQHQS